MYDACNSFPSFFKQIDTEQLKDEKNLTYNVDEMTFDYPQTIEESIQINETAKQKVIGLTVETRPEYVTHENCQMRRKW